MTQLVEVFSGSAIDAELVRSALEAAGIDATLVNENMGSLAAPYLSAAGLGAVRVAVSEADAERAREIIDSRAHPE